MNTNSWPLFLNMLIDEVSRSQEEDDDEDEEGRRVSFSGREDVFAILPFLDCSSSVGSISIWWLSSNLVKVSIVGLFSLLPV